MAGESKDVELRIRARDYSTKTLDQVADALKGLEKAQASQLDSAKRGEIGAKALEDSYRKLESAAQALIAQHSLTKNFETQGRTLADVTARVDAARLAQEAYAKSLSATEVLTKKQEREQAKLARAVEVAERAQRIAADRLAATTGRLAQYGIAADNVSAAQERIASAVGDANRALERQDAALQTVDADARAFRQTQEDVAKAAREAADAAAREVSARDRQLQVDRQFNAELAKVGEAEARRIQDAADKRAAADKESEAGARDAMAARERQLQVDRQFGNEVRKVTDAQERETKALAEQRDAMTKAADKADDLLQSYSRLARAGNQGSKLSIAEQVRGITNPASEAEKSLDGLAASLDKIEALATSATGPIKGYKAAVTELEVAHRALNSVAGQLDAYQRQMTAVRAAREEFVAARREVRELGVALRSGNGTPEMVANLSRAEVTLKRTSEAMQRQTDKAGVMRRALREAGIDTTKLADAEQHLVAQTNRAVSVTNQLTAAFEKNGAAADGANKKFGDLFGGRSTLSFMQRMRGELLGISAGLVGVQAGVDLARGVIETAKSAQSIQSRLGAMFGDDTAKMSAEWDYLMAQSDRFGLSFEKIAGAYTKFGVSAMSSGKTLQETRFIFENVAAASTKLRMSTEDTEGVLKALEQMMNKGKIQAEELTGQLGDRLVGALALAARGAGKTVEEFTKMMELGQVDSSFVINLAREMGNTYGAIDAGTDSLVQVLARFDNAKFNFQKALGDAGFIDAYSDFLKRLSAVLGSEEGLAMARKLSTVFTVVVDVLAFAAEHVELLTWAFGAFIALNVAGGAAAHMNSIKTLITTVFGLRTAVGAANAFLAVMPARVAAVGAAAGLSAGGVSILTRAVGLLTLGLKMLARAVPIIGVALMAYEGYKHFFGDGQEDGKEYGKEFAKGAKAGAATSTADPGTGGSPDKMLLASINKTLETENKRSGKQSTAARMKGVKGELQGRLDIAAEPFDQLKEQAQQIKSEKDRADALVNIDKALKERLAAETLKFNNEQAKSGESAANKRANLMREVADEIGRIEDDLAKRDASLDPMATYQQRLTSRTDAIAHEYDKLMRKIEQMARFDPKGAATAKAKLGDFIKQRQELETIKVKQEEIQRLEGNLNTASGLRTQRLEEIQALYKAGVLTQVEMREKTIAVNEVFGIGIESAADKLLEFAETVKSLLDPATYEALVSRVNAMRVNADPGRQNVNDLRADAEKKVNDTLAARQVLLERIAQQEALGIITNEQAALLTNQINGEFKQAILDNTQALISYLELTRTEENAASVNAQIAAMRTLSLETNEAKMRLTEFEQVAAQSLMGGAMTAIDSMAQSMAGFILQQKSAKDMFKDMGRASMNFFAQFLKDIAMAIIKQQILKMMQSSGNPMMMAAGALLGGASGAGQKHNGGQVGAPGGRVRRVSPSVFAGAQRLHSGGIPGLQPNEVPTILERNEEVLTRDDPRHVLNGGGNEGGGAGNRFVLVDDRSKVAEAMASAEGETVTMVHLRRNIASLKQMLK